MIERQIIAQKMKELNIRDYITAKLGNAGVSYVKLKKIPLGEKIVVGTSRPSLVIGSKGVTIKEITLVLKKRFKLENPQVEVSEIKVPNLDSNCVAEQIAGSLERFGSKRFKGVGHKTLQHVMGAGALGVEILMSGKIPGARAKTWRFYEGYLKKCGDVSVTGVLKSQATAALKSGAIGIKVNIMPPNVRLPDYIELLEEPIQFVEELDESSKPGKKAESKKPKSKSKKTVKKAAKKTTKKAVKKTNIKNKEIKTTSAPEVSTSQKIKSDSEQQTETKSETKSETKLETKVDSQTEKQPEKQTEQKVEPTIQSNPSSGLGETSKKEEEVKNEDN